MTVTHLARKAALTGAAAASALLRPFRFRSA